MSAPIANGYGLAPLLSVRRGAAAVEFYKAALGAGLTIRRTRGLTISGRLGFEE